MEDLEKLGRQLESGPLGDSLRQAAASAEGRRLMGRLDAQALEKAAREGDMQSLKNILASVLASPEGKALAGMIKQAAGGK